MIYLELIILLSLWISLVLAYIQAIITLKGERGKVLKKKIEIVCILFIDTNNL